jgi:deoxyribodipyrimidine photo-lyase
MTVVLLWFRRDLRLHDQPALQAALDSGATHVLPVAFAPSAQETTRWGFARTGAHRCAFVAAALHGLRARTASLGNPLLVCSAPPIAALTALARAVGASSVVCEDIAAPEEQAKVAALQAAGLQVRTVWGSSLLAPADMPWPVGELPGVFTTFRQRVEREGIAPALPLPAPGRLPPPPQVPGDVLDAVGAPSGAWAIEAPADLAGQDARSSFPYGLPAFHGAEDAALAHLAQYMARKLPHSYKATCNGLTGIDYSSKFSPWLATGALSPRQIHAALKEFENQHGANDGTYWLWFELLWRDYFRLLHLQHGIVLYRARGLSPEPLAPHNAQGFERWCEGRTGEPLVDAAMRELAATGYLSNRLRQVAASYLIHELQGDWRAGAAWFESQLLDYDVYSNQGNWLYIAGRGTDPRGGRRFNPAKQAAEHDADGRYRRLWGAA